MIYFDILVPIPKGAQKNKKNYVYYIKGRTYIKEKGYCSNQTDLIGKVSDHDRTKMHPNQNYLTYYQLPEDAYFSNEKNDFESVIQVGFSFILKKIFSETKLDLILKNVFSDKADLIKILVHYFISEESTTIQKFSKWFSYNYSFMSKKVSEATISNLFNHYIKPNHISDFLAIWNKYLSTFYEKEEILFSVDSTNININSNQIEIAEYGHAKKDENLPQVNLAYAIDQKTGLPLFYDLYPGSIIDQTHLELFVEKARNYDYRKLCFIMDRGYYSAKNVEFLIKNNYNYILMARIAANNTLKNLFQIYSKKIKDNPKYSMGKYQMYGIKIKANIFENIEDEQYIYLFYNPEKSHQKIKDFWEKSQRFKNRLYNQEKLTQELEEQHKKYLIFKTDENQNILKVSINKKTEEDITNKGGYFMIISNKDMTKEEILEEYKKRDSIEKLFRAVKTNLDSNKLYAQNTDTLESKILITFIAAIVRSYFSFKTKKIRDLETSETVFTTIEELEKIRCIKSSFDRTYKRKYPLTKKQKDILEIFNLSEKDLIYFIQEINKNIC